MAFLTSLLTSLFGQFLSFASSTYKTWRDTKTATETADQLKVMQARMESIKNSKAIEVQIQDVVTKDRPHADTPDQWNSGV